MDGPPIEDGAVAVRGNRILAVGSFKDVSRLYAGKSIDRKAEGQSPHWSPWSWNPIQVGDAFRNRAKILEYKKTGNELYVKCIPMQWDMNNKPAEAEMEQPAVPTK